MKTHDITYNTAKQVAENDSDISMGVLSAVYFNEFGENWPCYKVTAP